MAKAHTLVDNFNNDAVDTAKWGTWGTPAPITDRVTEVNGRVEIRPVASASYSTGNYYSLVAYDLRDSWAHVELVRPLRSAPGTGTILTAVAASGIDRVMFYLVENRIRIVQQGSICLYIRKGLLPSFIFRKRRGLCNDTFRELE